jgi:hypothetical protein
MPQIALIVPLGELPGLIPGAPGYPDQGLPSRPGFPGRPIDPGFGWGGRPPHVGNRPPGSWDRPEYPSTGPVRPGRPIDPNWGVDEGGGGLWPLDPAHPIAPPVPGEPEPPPIDPPPGTIWPPLPPNIPAGKALVYAGIAGVGYRYIVIDIPENPPELPPRPQPKG